MDREYENFKYLIDTGFATIEDFRIAIKLLKLAGGDIYKIAEVVEKLGITPTENQWLLAEKIYHILRHLRMSIEEFEEYFEVFAKMYEEEKKRK